MTKEDNVREKELLRECSVHVLYDPEHYPSLQMVPWKMILETLPQA